ncbi:hypothetical protein [Vibrio sp. SCSIO 43136]|uniref:hypothetical protein n=1 Tax=Vibrio sp. SCSIO 43136 TaxID=2819101 RepID=UPI0020752E00|nr:hypothetical protein [Vibrio sp. SCSIO 43136]USD65722.1 hypothetical protein J4N39_02520 [Vibrio sp. SCSIO 43136]
MKAAILLGAALLAGCATSQVDTQAPWGADQQVSFAQATLELNSSLWINMMPSAAQDREFTLNAALYIVTQQELPADLAVSQVVLRQGDTTQIISTSDFELRTHSEQQWEVALNTGMNIDSDKSVDVALELNHDGQTQWLIERNVKVDVAY